MSPMTSGIISLFGAAFLYGSQNIATRIAGSTYAPFLSSALRCLVVILVLSWFVKWQRIRNTDWKWYILRAAGNAVGTTCLFFAISKMPIGVALFSFYAGIILSGSLFGIIFYHEKMTIVKILSLLLTAGGLILIYINKTNISLNINFIIAVFGGISVSLWSVFSRPISSKYPLPMLVVVDSFLAAIIAIIISLAIHESWTSISFNPKLLPILYLGLTQVFTGQLVAKGFRTVDAQVGSIILLNDPVIGTILSFLFFHELIPINVIIGGACILGSSILPAVFVTKKSK